MRTLGYHGLRSFQGEPERSAIQCHDRGSAEFISHTGLPMAAARCTTAVSTEMTRSRLATSAAVSSEDGLSGRTSSTYEPLFCCRSGPICNEMRLGIFDSSSSEQLMFSNGLRSSKCIDLRLPYFAIHNPSRMPDDQHRPILRPDGNF